MAVFTTTAQGRSVSKESETEKRLYAVAKTEATSTIDSVTWPASGSGKICRCRTVAWSRDRHRKVEQAPHRYNHQRDTLLPFYHVNPSIRSRFFFLYGHVAYICIHTLKVICIFRFLFTPRPYIINLLIIRQLPFTSNAFFFTHAYLPLFAIVLFL